MDQGVYVALDLRIAGGDWSGWRRAPLAPRYDELRGRGDFDHLDTSDDDLLGEGNTLGPDATVADLLAHLAREADDGVAFFGVSWEEERVRVRGFLGDWDAYRAHRLPLVYAAAAAADFGVRGTLSLLGQVDDEIVTVLIDVEDGAVRVAVVDPQNLGEDAWNERLGGMEDFDRERRAWAKKARRRARR